MGTQQAQRDFFTETVTIANGAALSGAFDFSRFANMVIHMPAAWTAASIGFQVSSSQGGTYQPLKSAADAVLEIDTPTATNANVAPTGVTGALWVKLWSETAGSGVNQGAERTLVVDMKG